MLKKILHYIASHLKEIASVFAALGITIPLMIAVIEYKEKAKLQEDKNFREIIEKLSSKDVDTRTAAATSMGTFIGKGGKFEDVIIVNKLPFIKKRSKYEHEAINILKNRLLIETEYSVSNAIRGSLLNFKDKKKLIEDLLKTEQLNLNKSQILENQLLIDSLNVIKHSQKRNFKPDSILYLNSLKNYNISIEKQCQSTVNAKIVSDLIGTCLQLISIDTAVTHLHFFQNSLNNCALVNCKLRCLYMTHSAISDATMDNCVIDRSCINNTVFTSSKLYKSIFMYDTISECVFDFAELISVSFEGSKFRNVFFIGANVNNTDFRGVESLMVINFYGAKNLKKAIFDPSFDKLLYDSVKNVKAEDVINYIMSKPELIGARAIDLIDDAILMEKKLKELQ